MTETREETGRRRKHYSLTAKGRAALDEWRSEPTSELAELREPALLKLFFGADPQRLAAVQVDANRTRLAEYEAIRDSMPDDAPSGPRQSARDGHPLRARGDRASGRSRRG